MRRRSTHLVVRKDDVTLIEMDSASLGTHVIWTTYGNSLPHGSDPAWFYLRDLYAAISEDGLPFTESHPLGVWVA